MLFYEEKVSLGTLFDKDLPVHSLVVVLVPLISKFHTHNYFQQVDCCYYKNVLEPLRFN